jgi:hypothetical protein
MKNMRVSRYVKCRLFKPAEPFKQPLPVADSSACLNVVVTAQRRRPQSLSGYALNMQGWGTCLLLRGHSCRRLHHLSHGEWATPPWEPRDCNSVHGGSACILV